MYAPGRVVVFAWVLVAGCGDKDKPLPIPERWDFRYTYMTPKDTSLVEGLTTADRRQRLQGWGVRVGGERVSTVPRGPTRSDIRFSLPSAKAAAAIRDIAFVAKTPCGEWVLPVEPAPRLNKDSDARMAKAKTPEDQLQVLARAVFSNKIELYSEYVPPVVKASPVVIDWGDAKDVVKIGDLELPVGATTVDIAHKPGCATEHPVTVGGETIGTWKASDGATFISVDPKLCHVSTAVAYGTAPRGTPRSLTGRVIALEGAPDYFLVNAPARIEERRDTTSTYRIEIVRGPCPAAP